MTAKRILHVAHVLIRSQRDGVVRFLLYPHGKWTTSRVGPYLSLPTKKTRTLQPDKPFEPFLRGSSIEAFLDAIMTEDLGLKDAQYVLEEELEPVEVAVESPNTGELTCYIVYPLDVWVDPRQHEVLRTKTKGQWMLCEDAARSAMVSPTAKAVFALVLKREQELNTLYDQSPEKEHEPRAKHRLLQGVSDRPSMDALASKWFCRNKEGVRHVPKKDLDEILDVGNRAFNLRVADPYLRYQMQGLGFTWSFFTHKDKQCLHVHGAPTVEIYGILRGSIGLWWKAYSDRGASAWNHEIVKEGGWIEVDSLKCHIAHWIGKGKGVVFKASSGPLAEVGRLGLKGKTRCKDCAYPCLKPREVVDLDPSSVC